MFINKMVFLLAFLLMLTACNGDPKEKESSNPSDLEEARAKYKEGKFQESAHFFARHLKTTDGDVRKQEEREEAKLGLIVSQLRGNLPEYRKNIEEFKAGERGYWEGKSFFVLESLTKEQQAYLGRSMEGKEFPSSLFAVLYLLMSQDGEAWIPVLLEKSDSKKIAYEFCLATAWAGMKENKYSSRRIFETLSSKVGNVSEELLSEAQCGLALAKMLEGKETLMPKKDVLSSSWQYRMDLESIPVFRDNSVLKKHEAALNGLTEDQMAWVSMGDMIFVLGGKSRNRIDVWNKGIRWISSWKSSFRDEPLLSVCATLEARFHLAIAWASFASGNLKKAEEIFKRYVSLEKEAEWRQEARLGTTLLLYKETESIQEASHLLMPWENGLEYRIAGRRFSFYRYPSREKNRESIEKMARQEEHLAYLVIFDALCLLGDGRGAHAWLGRIVSRYSEEELRRIYLSEEQNVPKDAYAENQIWEKLD